MTHGDGSGTQCGSITHRGQLRLRDDHTLRRGSHTGHGCTCRPEPHPATATAGTEKSFIKENFHSIGIKIFHDHENHPGPSTQASGNRRKADISPDRRAGYDRDARSGSALTRFRPRTRGLAHGDSHTGDSHTGTRTRGTPHGEPRTGNPARGTPHGEDVRLIAAHCPAAPRSANCRHAAYAGKGEAPLQDAFRLSSAKRVIILP